MTTTLRVAQDTDPAKAAGAIAHTLRDEDRVHVQAVGAYAVNAATKALAIANNFMVGDGRILLLRVRFVPMEEDEQRRSSLQWLAWTVDGRGANQP